MKIHHFDGIYQERWGFSWAMLVYQRVSRLSTGLWKLVKQTSLKCQDCSLISGRTLGKKKAGTCELCIQRVYPWKSWWERETIRLPFLLGHFERPIFNWGELLVSGVCVYYINLLHCKTSTPQKKHEKLSMSLPAGFFGWWRIIPSSKFKTFFQSPSFWTLGLRSSLWLGSAWKRFQKYSRKWWWFDGDLP